MNQNTGENCLGHNCVHFKQPFCSVLRKACPPLVLWDYNFAFDSYVVSNYGGNLFSEQVPGYFYCGAHMVVIPNWGQQTLKMLHGTTGRLNHNYQSEISFECAMADLCPLLDIQIEYMSAKQAETHHPLVTATISAATTLLSCRKEYTKTATWDTQKQYIGSDIAFIILYNAKHITCPLLYLNTLCK